MIGKPVSALLVAREAGGGGRRHVGQGSQHRLGQGGGGVPRVEGGVPGGEAGTVGRLRGSGPN